MEWMQKLGKEWDSPWITVRADSMEEMLKKSESLSQWDSFAQALAAIGQRLRDEHDRQHYSRIQGGPDSTDQVEEDQHGQDSHEYQPEDP